MAHISETSPSSNEALTPLPDSARVFRWRDHAALWFSLGVGLLVMQVGAYLVPAVGAEAPFPSSTPVSAARLMFPLPVTLSQ